MTPRRPPRRAADPTRRVYEEESAVCLRRWDRRPYRRPALLEELLRRIPRGARILDLGCGPGQDGHGLLTAGYRATGLDFSRAFLRHARRRSRRLPLVLADIRRLPLRGPAFDAVWAAASLIHLRKAALRPRLRTIRRLVRRDGWLAATVAQGRASGLLRRGWLPGRFFARWGKAELAAALRAAGWEVVSLRAVVNRERKGRWLVVLARRPGGGGPGGATRRRTAATTRRSPVRTRTAGTAP